MVDYNALKKKFPTKDPQKKKKLAAIKAIKREYAAKRAALGGGAPTLKKGVIFYAVVILGLAILGSLVLSVTGKGGPKEISRAQMLVRKSIDSVAVALGRYRYHVGSYPSSEEGLEALAAITPRKNGWNGPYVNHVVKDPWGHDYVYVNNGESEYPTLYSKGPDGKAGTTDDVLPDRALYDSPFKDTSWTKGWMPYYLRGYVLAPDKRTKSAIEEEVKAVLAAEQGPAEGEFVLHDGWEFSRDQKEWKGVRVPHDWAISGPFDPKIGGNTGMLPWKGVGYYRRTIELPSDAAGKFVALRFGGVMASPEVFLNGERVGGWDYGYMSFEVDISAKIKFGEKNELLVKADTTNHNSRWYPGAGLYRDVKLVVEDAEDRAIWGSVKITTPEITQERAKVRVEYLTPVSTNPIVNEFEVERPVLWDVTNPKLYETTICGKKYRYGFRTAEFTANDGFHLNGRRVQLKGVDLNPDFGQLGMSFDKGALRRLLATLKDMGANAIRMPNNPPADEVLDLCDEMGIMVLASLPGKSNPCVVALPQAADFEAVEDLLDACAMPKERYWLYRSQWNDRKDTIQLLPHWNWDGREGEKVTVVCYTSGDEAELFVNGVSAGRRKKAKEAGAVVKKDDSNYYKVTERYRLVWEVAYEPGEIKVIAFRNGRPIGEDFRKTAYKAVAVKLTPEQAELADGELGFVKVELEDDDGTVLPLAKDRVNFKLEGPGEIVAVGNGSHNGLDSFADTSSHPLYYGRALVVVRRNGGSGLPLKLTVSAPSVRSASVTFSRR